MEKKKLNKSKVFVFIDGENIRNSIVNLANDYIDLNYVDLFNYFRKKKGASKIYIYVGIENGDNVKEEKFNKLRDLGYSVYAKDVQSYKQQPYYRDILCQKCNNTFIQRFDRPDKKKANCDAELTLDLVKHGCLNDYDEVIVFTGDGDFARVFEYIVDSLKKKVTVYSTMNKRTHTKIKNLATEGKIILEDLGGILSEYGEKLIVS